MKYTIVSSALAPHQYQHDLVLPASYIVVEPKKGHSTTFRVREGCETSSGLFEVRRRGFRPLYVIRARAKGSPSDTTNKEIAA